MKYLTKDNVDWLFREASVGQGCLPPDECDENRKILDEMKKEFEEVLKLVRLGAKRDKQVIQSFLKKRGLREL